MALTAKVSEASRAMAHNTPRTTLERLGEVEAPVVLTQGVRLWKAEEEFTPWPEPQNQAEANLFTVQINERIKECERLLRSRETQGSVRARLGREATFLDGQRDRMKLITVEMTCKSKQEKQAWLDGKAARIAEAERQNREHKALMERQGLDGYVGSFQSALAQMKDFAKIFGSLMNRVTALEAIREAADDLLALDGPEARERLEAALREYAAGKGVG